MEENKTTNSEKRANPFPVLILVLALCVYAVIYFSKPKKEELIETPESTETPTVVITPEPEAPIKTTVTVEEIKSILSPASDLITSRYYYTNAADFESVKNWPIFSVENPFTRSGGYIMYDGVVSVGIDISQISYEVDNDQQIITVSLPKEKVLAHEVDNSSVVTDAHVSMLNILDADYYTKLIAGLQEETEEKVMSNNAYMKEVRQNTETVIKTLLSATELTSEYKVRFK